MLIRPLFILTSSGIISEDPSSNAVLIENIKLLINLHDTSSWELKNVIILKTASKRDVVLEVSPTERKTLLNNGYVWIGWKKSALTDNIQVIRYLKCFNCDHYTKNCNFL